MPERCAVFLMGPTATGKTELAIALADRYPVALINADSAQVYRGMDVGTAKPDAGTRSRYPHALMDCRDPAEPFSAGDYARAARAEAQASHARGRVPLLVGGTGLYLQAFVEGLSALPAADATVRTRLQAEAAASGWPALHTRLAAVDPKAAARIEPNDSQRITRALEVHTVTGRPMTAVQAETALAPVDYPVLRLALWLPRATIWARIETRFQRMLAAGLLDEVRALMAAGVPADAPAMRAVGYRQARRYLEGTVDYAGMIDEALAATRQLAKRQRTWFRRMPGVEWYRPEAVDALAERVANFWPKGAGGLVAPSQGA